MGGEGIPRAARPAESTNEETGCSATAGAETDWNQDCRRPAPTRIRSANEEGFHMNRQLRFLACVAAVAVFSALSVGEVSAQYGSTYRHGNVYSTTQAPNDLFYNYYAPGGNAMYPAPLSWTPEYVGHTYFTYPPLYPHHYLEPHRLSYTDGERTVNVKYSHHGGQILRSRRWIEQRWQPRLTFPNPLPQ